ncbi:ABC transporter substrate-binding protein [Corynebacterium pacaense]|uniref:ABC transporter substrate-binding protein n=1 Tax=Corynebacterium pacaense TaxID=1816684 RepID=UPI001C4DF576|nr:ABC transporter substrate-binding protein [Corynebacterium pacaense]
MSGALLIVGALALAGCSSSAEEAQTQTEGPVEGGVLKVAFGSDTPIINPHLSGSSITATIAREVVDSLVSQDVNNEIHPWLASDWSINDDNTEYTFTIRDDVTFSDGETLDAGAVKENFDFILDPANNSNYARSLLGPVAAIEAPDASTLIIRYDTPFSPLLQGLSLPYLGIQSSAFINGGGELTNRIVGSGPFLLDSYVQGQGSKLSKRDDYNWGPTHLDHTGPAHLDGIEYSYLPEASTRLGALESGQVDAIDAIPPANNAGLRGNDDIVIDTYENPGVPWTFQLNTETGPFSDPLVRQAFQTAVDIDAGVQATYFGTVEPATGPLSSHTQYADASIDGSWKNDPDRAAELLDQAGWTERDSEGYRTKDGKRLSVRWVYDAAQSGQDNVNLVQALQSGYRESGIELVLDSVDSGTLTSRNESGDYDIVAYFFVRAEPDILRTVYGSATIGAGNSSRVSSLDGQLNEAVGASGERREELYAQVQQEIINEAYSVPIYVPNYQLAHTSDLQGVEWATNAKPFFYNSFLSR